MHEHLKGSARWRQKKRRKRREEKEKEEVLCIPNVWFTSGIYLAALRLELAIWEAYTLYSQKFRVFWIQLSFPLLSHMFASLNVKEMQKVKKAINSNQCDRAWNDSSVSPSNPFNFKESLEKTIPTSKEFVHYVYI